MFSLFSILLKLRCGTVFANNRGKNKKLGGELRNIGTGRRIRNRVN